MITHTRIKYHTSQASQHTHKGNIHTTNVNTVYRLSGNPWSRPGHKGERNNCPQSTLH
jgi:hypothetical protein